METCGGPRSSNVKYNKFWVTALVAALVVLLAGLYLSQSISQVSSVGASSGAGPIHYGHPVMPASPASSAALAASGNGGCPLAPAECWASLNWGGYVDYNASYLVTKVTGSWIVPAILGAHAGYCPDAQKTWDDNSVWVGIDGFSDSTVEQTGTSSDCFYGQVSYYPWYEFYPAGSEAFPSADVVNAGDLMIGSVNYVGASAGGPVFTTTLTDVTQHWSFTSPATAVPGAEMNSAEWIDESAYYDGFLGLTQVNSVSFGDASATINGHTHFVGDWGSNVQWLTMVDYAWSPGTGLTYVKAYPSAFNGQGSGFSVTWVSNGP